MGSLVSIYGTGFTGVTAVKFNVTNATWWYRLSSTRILARVPAGATTGPISVTTGAGTATSSTNFTLT